MHYWYAKFLFTDVGAACGVDGACYVKNGKQRGPHAQNFLPALYLYSTDNPLHAFFGSLSVSMLRLTDGNISLVANHAVNLSIGAGSMQWTCVDGAYWPCAGYGAALASAGCLPDGSNCLLLLDVTRNDGTNVMSSHELLAPPSALVLPQASVEVTGISACPGGACITLSSSATALYVTLTTAAQGRFSDNAFILPVAVTSRSPPAAGVYTVNFTFFGYPDVALLASTLRVEHAQMYQSKY